MTDEQINAMLAPGPGALTDLSELTKEQIWIDNYLINHIDNLEDITADEKRSMNKVFYFIYKLLDSRTPEDVKTNFNKLIKYTIKGKNNLRKYLTGEFLPDYNDTSCN